ncbi:hypothetical protein GCM10009863_32830 [Streptomyces axinellae]|uniref:Uncharacterized protein n=1 Tax=Streptomyces axinellae TaxID=552788 RepID=A0ABN3Q4I4_9ACTN
MCAASYRALTRVPLPVYGRGPLPVYGPYVGPYVGPYAGPYVGPYAAASGGRAPSRAVPGTPPPPVRKWRRGGRGQGADPAVGSRERPGCGIIAA